jgi:hypothetical protein
MRKILIMALAAAGVGSAALSARPVRAAPMNGLSLVNGIVLSNGISFAVNGADLSGLSLKAVVLPDTAE